MKPGMLRNRMIAIALIFTCACAAALPFIATAITIAQQVQEWANVIAGAVPSRVPQEKQQYVLDRIDELVKVAKVLEKAGETGQSLSQEEYDAAIIRGNELYVAITNAIQAFGIVPDSTIAPEAYASTRQLLAARPDAIVRVPTADNLLPLPGSW